ncbi:MAG: hypothetical protein RBS80_26800 [Thermoguttaceae bacterium]|jgi:hypothetical protein|nr:hypothetical protein [Thermoguttaceae bacterium]
MGARYIVWVTVGLLTGLLFMGGRRIATMEVGTSEDSTGVREMEAGTSEGSTGAREGEQVPCSLEWNQLTDRMVEGWLESQRKGRDGLEFWINWKKAGWVDEPQQLSEIASLAGRQDFVPFRLYAVSDYEIVDAPNVYTRVVRIHHATKGGFPVVNIYEFSVCYWREGILGIRRR